MPDPTERLYGLPLEEFIPARDATAREVRRGGDRESAARIAKLAKPTPAAWTANQVAREQPELMEALLAAGTGLREAQEAAVAGEGAGGLREATAAQRAAIDAVMAAAAAYRPGGRPLSSAMADRLRTTLNAAAGDDALREALAAGRLVGDAQAGGAWPFALEPAAPAKEGGKKPAPAKKRATPARDDAARREQEAAEREAERQAAREAAEARKTLEAELREARGSLRVRERSEAGASKAAARARARLEAARREFEEAEAEVEASAQVAEEARTALGEARDAVARLEERLD